MISLRLVVGGIVGIVAGSMALVLANGTVDPTFRQLLAKAGTANEDLHEDDGPETQDQAGEDDADGKTHGEADTEVFSGEHCCFGDGFVVV